MKLNLMTQDKPVNGYTNVRAIDSQGVINTLSEVDDAECSEILALHILEYIPQTNADALLNLWISKLKHKGTITLGVTNLRQVCKSLVSGAISLDHANVILYGEQKDLWECKKGLVDMKRMCDALASKGMNVTKKRIDGFEMFITAERP